MDGFYTANESQSTPIPAFLTVECEMAKTDPYFQFPVSMLRGMTDTRATVQNIVHRTAWKLGRSLYTDNPAIIDDIAGKYLQAFPSPPDFDQGNLSQCVLLAGAVRLRCKLGSVSNILKEAMRLDRQFPDEGTQVRIRADIMWSAYHDEWSPTKLAALCGVIGGIGNKGFARLTLRMIRAIGAGYNSPRGLLDSQLLSRSSTYRWCEQLWMSNLFQRAADGKDFWYSVSHENDRKLAVSVRRKLSMKQSKKRVSINDISPHEIHENRRDQK